MAYKQEILRINALIRIILLLSLQGVFTMTVSAQTQKVVKMEQAVFDLTASTDQHLDQDRKPAALIKVQLPEKGASFENTYLLPDSINYKDGEYMVYMAAGAKNTPYIISILSPITSRTLTKEIIVDKYLNCLAYEKVYCFIDAVMYMHRICHCSEHQCQIC